MAVKLPQLLMQSVPPLDDRGGDTALPPLFNRSWWMYFNNIASCLKDMDAAIDSAGTNTSGLAPKAITDTHANRANFDPANYVGGFYFETDRRLLYVSIAITSSGTVDTAGTGVTWVSGANFQQNWVGGQITINAVVYTIAAVAAGGPGGVTTLTLATSAGVQAAVAFSQGPTPEWAYVAGECSFVQASLPADLGTLDHGLLVQVSDYAHQLRWSGSTLAFGWAPGDAGSGMMGWFDVAPGAGWKLIDGLGDDGSAIGASHPIKILKSDGTLRNNTTAKDQTGGSYVRSKGTYSGTVAAAVTPTLSGTTASGTANLGVSTANHVGRDDIASFTAAASNHTHVDSGHTHAVGTLANDLTGGDPIAHSDWLPYIRK